MIAQWTAITYTLTIDPNGGTYGDSGQITSISGQMGDTIELEPASKTGSQFHSWSLTGVGRLNGATSFTFGAGPASLTANYTIENYYINVTTKYENTSETYAIGNDGGTVSGAQTNVEYNTLIFLSATPEEGFIFDGYYSDASLNTQVYSLPDYSFNATGNSNLYGKFSRKSCVLTINPNGGKYNNNSTNSTITQKFGLQTTILVPTRTNYNFVGWEIISGAGTFNANQTKFTFSVSAATIRANWEIKTITLQFNNVYEETTDTYTSGTIGGHLSLVSATDLDGDNVAGSINMANIVIAYGTTLTLIANENTGYQYNGCFNTLSSHNGETAYFKTEFVISFGDGDGVIVNDDKVYYARFGIKRLTLTLNYNSLGGGSTSITDISLSSRLEDVVKVLPTARAGYDFLGWNTSQNGSGGYIGDIVGPSGNRMTRGNINTSTGVVTASATGEFYYSRYIAVVGGTEYYIKNSGSIALNYIFLDIYKSKKSAGSVTSSTLNIMPAQSGYIVIYYGSSAGLEYGDELVLCQQQTLYSQALGTDSCTVYAQWSVATYTLTINPNGGTYSSPTTFVGNIGGTIMLESPSKIGNDFNGWEINGAGSVTAASPYTFTFGAGNATLTAKFTVLYYTPTVNLRYENSSGSYVDGATGGTVSRELPDGVASSFVYGTQIRLKATPAMGYVFAGYYSNSDLSTSITTNATYTFNIIADKVLYAKFTLIKRTLTLNYNNGNGSTSIPNVWIMTPLEDLLKIVPTEVVGNTLLGWNTQQFEGGEYIGDLIGPLGNRFTRGTCNDTTGVVTASGSGDVYYSRFIAVTSGVTYYLRGSGTTPVSYIAYDEGMAMYQTGRIDNATLTFAPSRTGYVVLYYSQGAGVTFGNSMVLCQNENQVTYKDIFGENNGTAHARWRLKKHYVTLYSMTQKFYQDDLSYTYNHDEMADYVSSIGGTSTVNGTTISTTPSNITKVLVNYGQSNAISLALSANSNYFLSKVYQYNYENCYFDANSILSYNNVGLATGDSALSEEYTISSGQSQKTITHTVTNNQIICILYRSPVLLLKNEKVGQTVTPQAPYTTTYFPGLTFGSGLSTFKILDCAQEYLPVMTQAEASHQFYYFSTGNNSTEKGISGERYDLDNNYNYSLSTSRTEPKILYATYLAATSDWSSNGFNQAYVIVPYGITSLSYGSTTHSHFGTKIVFKNAFGHEYSCLKIGTCELLTNTYTTKYITLPRGLTAINADAFRALKGLTGVSLPVCTLTYIGTNAFQDTTLLTHDKFQLPNTLTTIGNGFLMGSGLGRVAVGGALTEAQYDGSGNFVSGLHPQAFNGARNLAWIDGSDNFTFDNYGILYCIEGNRLIRCPENADVIDFVIDVDSISPYAFYGCKNLRTASIINTNIELNCGEYAFSKCSSLFDVTIKTESITLGDSCFYNCAVLSNMILYGVNDTIIGGDCFAACSNLTYLEIDFDDIVTGDDMLNSCSKLSTVILKSENNNTQLDSAHSLQYLGVTDGWLFYDQFYLNTNSRMPFHNTTGVGTQALLKVGKYSCDSPNFSDWVLSDGAIVGYKGSYKGTETSPLVVPDTLYQNGIEYKITKLYSLINPVRSASYVEHVYVSPNIVTIGDGTNGICGASNTSLSSVVIGQNVTTISANAFRGCSALTGEIILPNVSYSLGDYAFFGTAITKVVINNAINIGDSAFSGCSSLIGEIILPENSYSIGEEAFLGSSINIVVFNNIDNIGARAFKNCEYLYEMVFTTVPNSVGTNAFEGIYDDNTDPAYVKLADGANFGALKSILDGKGFPSSAKMMTKESDFAYTCAYYDGGVWHRLYPVYLPIVILGNAYINQQPGDAPSMSQLSAGMAGAGCSAVSDNTYLTHRENVDFYALNDDILFVSYVLVEAGASLAMSFVRSNFYGWRGDGFQTYTNIVNPPSAATTTVMTGFNGREVGPYTITNIQAPYIVRIEIIALSGISYYRESWENPYYSSA